MVKRAGAAAGLGIKVHAHMLRHACGFKLANDGIDTRSLQAYLGHSNIQNTARYTALAASQNKSNKGTSKKQKKDKSSSANDFLTGYHAAYALIYDKGDYEAGIAALRALGYDDNADVATLLGYASRKLSRYDDAKMWYERALAADPNHAVTWSYYGMWQAEQGNVLKAKDDLEKVRLICGTDCKAFQMLKNAIDGTVTY
jgi:tetratricopeptide (TPR) repeat protein